MITTKEQRKERKAFNTKLRLFNMIESEVEKIHEVQFENMRLMGMPCTQDEVMAIGKKVAQILGYY